MESDKTITPQPDYEVLSSLIKSWAVELGFQQAGITGIDLKQDEKWLFEWLEKQRHGEMEYMQRHGTRRSRPADLEEGTLRVISVRMDYFPDDAANAENILDQKDKAYVSRYALGRDYHKLLRKRLQKLADKIEQSTGKFGYRVFVDSAPVLEKALARNSGLGWIGKHTNLINRHAGSWFFLGEIYTDLPLPTDPIHQENYCGTCSACIDVCPTQAIVAPFQVDARRCISYLTIELRTSIPEEFRKMIGNRIYGCDDCQLVCPWNKYAVPTSEADFAVRNDLDASDLISLFNWTEEEFLKKTEGSAIRRIGYESWLRNIAIALGNSAPTENVLNTLKKRQKHQSELVREHVEWAIKNLTEAV
ncbi:MAG: tRNA epoxyqueuosine(34) reductase QueG [Gammaproteobacteria bacterium]